MAEFQGVSYAQVAIWAAIPAILYHVACFGGVHFEAKRQGLMGVPRSDLTPMRARLSAITPPVALAVYAAGGLAYLLEILWH
jgi:TRAP-type uncharacterized transport system fused permease subunit